MWFSCLFQNNKSEAGIENSNKMFEMVKLAFDYKSKRASKSSLSFPTQNIFNICECVIQFQRQSLRALNTSKPAFVTHCQRHFRGELKTVEDNHTLGMISQIWRPY